MRILCLTHAPFEGPAAIADWATRHNHSLSIVESWRTAIPAPEPFQALVIMGGPMSVNDFTKLPWLSDELDWIASWLEHDRGPALGVCLGSQMLAHVIGGSVTRSPYTEIGWWPVQRTAEAQHARYFCDWPESVDIFHWHGEMAELPPDARVTLRSQGCPVQAWEWGIRTVGLQCHPEMTEASIAEIGTECAHELVPGSYIQTDLAAMSDAPRITTAHRLLDRLLDRLMAA